MLPLLHGRRTYCLRNQSRRASVPLPTKWELIVSLSPMLQNQDMYQSIQQFNSSKQLLPPAIEDMVVKFLLGLADMGLGMDPKMLTEKANKIIQETIDPKHEGVDHNFTTHFFAQHEKQLITSLSNTNKSSTHHISLFKTSLLLMKLEFNLALAARNV